MSSTLAASINAEREASGKRRTRFFAAVQIIGAEHFRREDRFRRLRVSADDDGFGHGLEPPAGGDSLDLARGVFAVAARADQHQVLGGIHCIMHGGFIGRRHVAIQTARALQ